MPNTSLEALRAISALALRRLFHPAIFMTTIVLVALWVLTLFLALSFSAWWLLLLVLVIPITFVFIVLRFMVSRSLQALLPRSLEKHEQAKLDAFCDKLLGIAERTKTPYPILLFLIGKDVFRGRESNFVSGLLGDSRDLMREFSEIQEMFKD